MSSTNSSLRICEAGNGHCIVSNVSTQSTITYCNFSRYYRRSSFSNFRSNLSTCQNGKLLSFSCEELRFQISIFFGCAFYQCSNGSTFCRICQVSAQRQGFAVFANSLDRNIISVITVCSRISNFQEVTYNQSRFREFSLSGASNGSNRTTIVDGYSAVQYFFSRRPYFYVNIRQANLKGSGIHFCA